MSEIVPVGWVVVVKPDTMEERTKSGLFLPKNAIERQQMEAISGTVVSVGDEAYNRFAEGSFKPKTGDKVLFAKYGGQVTELNGITYRILNDQDILGVVTE